ncbi:hypothetical protein [Ralstonia phage RP13]|nr:hypothetical protein [Ralstonia phage RP13]
MSNTNNVGINPHIQQFESLSYDQLVPTRNRVFSDKEEEKLLSVLQRSLDNSSSALTKEQADKMTGLMEELIQQSARNELNETTLVKVVQEFQNTGLKNLNDINEYLHAKQQFDIANLIRNSNNEAAKNAGDVNLALRLDNGDMDEASDDQKKIVKESSKKNNVLKNNIRLLSNSEELSTGDKEALDKLFKHLDSQEQTFEEMSANLKKFTDLDTTLSQDTKSTLQNLNKILSHNDVDSVATKIKGENSRDLFNENFKELDAKLDKIKSDGGIVGRIKDARTAEEAGSNAADWLMDKAGGKWGKLSKLAFNPYTITAAAGVGAWNTVSDNEDAVKAGKMTKDQQIESNSKAVGGLAGAGSGAALGAGIGAAFGGVGAVPGAIIGGALGYFGGGAAGKYVGKGVNAVRNLFSKEDKQVLKEQNKENEKNARSFSSITEPLTNSVDALHASMTDYGDKYEKMTASFSDYTKATKEAGGQLLDGLAQAGSTLWESVKSAGGSVVDAVSNGYKEGGLGHAITSGFKSLGGAGGKIWEGAKSAGGQVSDAVKLAGQTLGSVSAKYESGGRGVGTISSGAGDAGGVSYGAHQLASKNGSMAAFLNSNEAKSAGISDQFNGLTPGSAAFNAKYKEVTSGSGKDAMEKAQHDYMQRTHFNVQAAKLQKELGIDVSKESRGFQEAVWSTATQYGPNTSLIVDALRGKDLSKMSSEDKIRAIQEYKANTINTKFKSSSDAVKAGIAKRIANEQNDLLGVDKVKENPEIANLRAQGMPETEIQKIAALSGNSVASKHTSSTPTTDASKLAAKPSNSKSSSTDTSTPASSNTTSVVINQSSPQSGYSIDAMRYGAGGSG